MRKNSHRRNPTIEGVDLVCCLPAGLTFSWDHFFVSASAGLGERDVYRGGFLRLRAAYGFTSAAGWLLASAPSRRGLCPCRSPAAASTDLTSCYAPPMFYLLCFAIISPPPSNRLCLCSVAPPPLYHCFAAVADLTLLLHHCFHHRPPLLKFAQLLYTLLRRRSTTSHTLLRRRRRSSTAPPLHRRRSPAVIHVISV